MKRTKEDPIGSAHPQKPGTAIDECTASEPTTPTDTRPVAKSREASAPRRRVVLHSAMTQGSAKNQFPPLGTSRTLLRQAQDDSHGLGACRTYPEPRFGVRASAELDRSPQSDTLVASSLLLALQQFTLPLIAVDTPCNRPTSSRRGRATSNRNKRPRRSRLPPSRHR